MHGAGVNRVDAIKGLVSHVTNFISLVAQDVDFIRWNDLLIWWDAVIVRWVRSIDVPSNATVNGPSQKLPVATN